MPQSIAQSFLRSVERQLSSDAVIAPRGTWSYEALAGLAGAVANYLAALNLERGDRVGLLLQNSAEYVGVFYGTQVSGRVTVPLNFQEPATVIAHLLEHCEARVLFVQRTYRDLKALQAILQERGVEVVVIQRGDVEANDRSTWADIRRAATTDCQQYFVDTRSGDLASIMYTSGTTGNPKGVMLSQRNLFANTASILDYLDLSWIDRGFNILPFHYSFGNSVLHTHMTAGACLVLQDNVAFPRVVLAALQEHRASGFYGVPTTFSLLFGAGSLAEYDFSSLRYVAQAGGPMSVEQTRYLQEVLPGVDIFVMYGQTEATARLTCLPPGFLESKIGSVGTPIAGVKLRLGPDDSNRGSADAPLDVYVSGDNIMLGYWKDPIGTAAVLRDGWLRTGDLGYMDEDGFLYLTGRSSEMIKTGANRVSPQEIEEVIAGFEEVEAVAAYPVPDVTLGQAIAVAIVCKPGVDLPAKLVQRRCRAALSPYKVPKHLRFVDALPRTSSGKIKRLALAREFEENKQ
ncbi:class I adenylate-forming enzyme family protein [Woeseia oceani]|uniref:AMP-dependent synthetase n=1 Tax=Woeseia oceani TaxID=1548547 RepID=A0A193LEL7_9GAMM|nr:class I adenylate-forming enzyme family protein [Woeseia oceani]ANO50952.1 hypothetical protein BA177_06785 [Woeseia oceani]